MLAEERNRRTRDCEAARRQRDGGRHPEFERFEIPQRHHRGRLALRSRAITNPPLVRFVAIVDHIGIAPAALRSPSHAALQ
jgi:hypothetical protein